MKDELQTGATEDNGITIEGDETKTEGLGTVESGAELATATEENQDKNKDGEVSQDAVNKAINKQHAKFREEERKRLESDKKLAAAEEKLKALEAEKGDITIPEIPDSYDENYEDKIKARDEAIKQKAIQEAGEKTAIEKQNADIEVANKVEQERINSLVNEYDKRIVTLGLDANDIKNAVQTVVDYGVSGEVREFILQQEDGPLITKYLAENPIQLDELRNMTPIQAAFKISSEIREAAAVLKPQASNAPDPADVLAGRGAGEVVDPSIAGATFE